jgi:hypothetical protein
MGANIYIYCPAGEAGLSRPDLEEELETFFGGAAEDVGAGAGGAGFNLDYELADGEDPEQWANRLRDFLRQVGVRPGTVFEVFAAGWEPGVEWRRVEVFGSDTRLFKQ